MTVHLALSTRSRLTLGLLSIIGVLAACSGNDDGTSSRGNNATGSDAGRLIGIGEQVDLGDGRKGTAIDTNDDGVADGVDLNGDGKYEPGVDDCLPGPQGEICRNKPGCGMYCGNGPPPAGCGDTSYELTANKTNVMFLVDGSNSMSMNWTRMRDALVAIINANPDLNFGVHMFYANAPDLGDVVNKLNACGKLGNPRLEVGPGNGQQVVNAMGSRPPGAGNQFFDASPVLSALNWYLENDTPLDDADSSNFLVVISDLVDTCFGTLFSNPGSVSMGAGSEQLLAFQKLAVELRKKHIRVLPIGFDPKPQNMSMQGAAGAVNVEALTALTELGGTTLQQPLIATNDADLQEAIKQLGVAVQPCRFTVPAVAKDGLNAFKLSFLINNAIVPRDRTKKEGWDFVEGNTSEVEFHGDACRAIQSETVKVDARLDCGDEEVCGVAATKVETRARALQILLDGSASMWGNPLDPFFNNKLTPWGSATKALAGMVTNPINDDLEFGFSFFPHGAANGCNVDKPEVAVGPSSEISIVQTMSSKIPTGGTPLVAELNYVSSNPGRLAEPDVVGAVMVVSDGGDSCAPQASRVQSLADATTKLYNAGVKTFAVQFGTGDADQVTQLNNIAINGGTDTAPNDPDPKAVHFIQAPDQKALEAAFAQISDQLASCELRVGQLPEKVDPAKVNLYLSGVQVPFDAMGTKQGGWGWTSDTANGDYSKIELYGPHCDVLKNSRLSDLVIEFGCDTINLM